MPPKFSSAWVGCWWNLFLFAWKCLTIVMAFKDRLHYQWISTNQHSFMRYNVISHTIVWCLLMRRSQPLFYPWTLGGSSLITHVFITFVLVLKWTVYINIFHEFVDLVNIRTYFWKFICCYFPPKYLFTWWTLCCCFVCSLLGFKFHTLVNSLGASARSLIIYNFHAICMVSSS